LHATGFALARGAGLSCAPLDDEQKFAATVPETRSLPQSQGSQLRALVIRGETVQAFPLPQSGRVTIGRHPENEISIDHPGVSRQHAVLHLGPPLRFEDLGSANGTRLRGAALTPNEPVEIAPGDVVELGSSLLIVQGLATGARPLRLWGHGYFEGRLEEECARAEQQGSGFCVARIHVDGGVPDEQVLVEAIGPTDVVARYGPGEYEALLLDMDREGGAELTREISARLARRGAAVRTGLACYGRDGRSPESLLAHACAAVLGVAEGPAGIIVLADPAMHRLHDFVRRVAKSLMNILVLGETGVGKEILAAQVHALSARTDKPFLKLNCAALSESLLESELFGHEKGAFTGAVQAKPGLLETADSGTVFLDEVGELPMSMQVKLLRVIEERQLLRVGGLKPRSIDVRFVAATNRDLEAEVAAGRFRMDLYYRLNGVAVVVPPLRDRVCEIAPLARAFLAQACRQAGRRASDVSPEALVLLEGYGWPGNIRELRNFVERAALLCGDGPVQPEHLPLDKMSATVVTRADEAGQKPATDPAQRPATVRSETDEIERRRILEALEQSGGNQTRAAEILGMPLRTLVRRLVGHGVTRPRKGPAAPR